MKQKCQEDQHKEDEKGHQKNKNKEKGFESERDGSDDEGKANVPFLWNSSLINNSPSKDVESSSLSENTYSNNGHKKEFIRNISLTNDNVIKDYDNLLNKQDENHKSEKSDLSSVANSKKWDKFKQFCPEKLI